VFSPQPLKSINLPFDHSDFLFENKYDGFRALAVIEGARCRLVSRNGNEFKTFAFLASSIGSSIRRSAVLDGEVVCLDEQGHPRFDDLLFHRLEPCFVAFDILSLDGRDLRWNALVERKAELRRLLSRAINSRILYADHIEKRWLPSVRIDLSARPRRHRRQAEARALHFRPRRQHLDQDQEQDVFAERRPGGVLRPGKETCAIALCRMGDLCSRL